LLRCSRAAKIATLVFFFEEEEEIFFADLETVDQVFRRAVVFDGSLSMMLVLYC